MPLGFTVNSDDRLEHFKKMVEEVYQEKKYIRFHYFLTKPRTPLQNDAMWAFCGEIADKCNDAGYWLKMTSPVLTKEVEIPWTKDNVKERMWRPVQDSLYPKAKSSTNLGTVELSKVAEVLSNHLWEHHKIWVQMGKDNGN